MDDAQYVEFGQELTRAIAENDKERIEQRKRSA